MILTPTITIDKDNLANFNKEVKEFDKTPGAVTKHWGDGWLEGATIEIKKIRTPQGNGILLMVTDNGDDVLAVCRLVSAPVKQGSLPWGNKVYIMDRIRVHNNFIGRGIAPEIYNWLSRNEYTVISDSHQNSTSLAVWHKLGKQGGVFTVNLGDNSWRPYDPMKVEDWMLFGNNDQMRYWPIRFVLPSR